MAEQIAKLNHLRMAPRKVRLIADTIRGLSVNDAEAQLLFQKKRAAKPLLKLLRSAVANAKNNKMDPAKMIVGKIAVDNGPMLKRALPRARGVSNMIQKKTSHVTLVLQDAKNPKENRFNIVVVKKTKATDEKPKAKKAEKPKEEKPKAKKVSRKDDAEPKKAEGGEKGIMKKVFRRKAI